MEASRKERREHEKAEVLSRLRIFAEHSKWKKARLSRELGVSISTVERWLDGQDNIFLASMFTIRRFFGDAPRAPGKQQPINGRKELKRLPFGNPFRTTVSSSGEWRD